MKKCYFEVGKTYVDEYRKEFKITEVRPHFPHRNTWDNSVCEMPKGGYNYYDIFTDKPHIPWEDEKYAEKYESFEQDSYRYDKLVEINENPAKKDFICVVPGAHVICDRLEEDPRTRDYVTYAVFGKTWCSYYNDNKLTSDERKWLHEHVAKMQVEMTA